MARCALANRQLREYIEDKEDDHAESLQGNQTAKIFICDRRRAILEGVSNSTSTRFGRTPKNSESSDAGSASSSSIASTSSGHHSLGSSSKTKTRQQQTEQKRDRTRNISDHTKSSTSSADSSGCHPKASSFISDQYTDTLKPNWAFDFDFEPWLQEYDVTEVYFKNFCSFLEREKIEDPMSPSSYKGRTAYYENHNRENAAAAALQECQIIELTEATKAEMRIQSAGRIERLVERLSGLRDAHFIFKDSVCYGARPPVTIFYFLSLMRSSLRALTFDHVQSATAVYIHDLMKLEDIHQLTVIQPQSRQSVLVHEKLFTDWMHLPDHQRKRISVHLVGCQEFRPANLYAIVQAWLNLDKPVVFKQISIDGGSYKYNEFMDLIERLHDIIEKRPPRSPANRSFGNEQNEHSVVLERICKIPHPNDRRLIIAFKYCKPSRKMVLTIEKHVLPQQTLSPVPTSTRLTRPQSAASVITSPIRKISSSLKPASPIPTYNNNNNGRQLSRPLSHDPCHMTGCRENAGSNVFTRIVSFLGTSS